MTTRLLKRDGLGTISVVERAASECGGGDGIDGATVERDTRTARFGARWLARRLAAHEAAALRKLDGAAGVPALLGFDGAVVRRSYLCGERLDAARPLPRIFFTRALRLLREIHRRGVVHNDLAKEANWLAGPDGTPGIVDFQLAYAPRRRNKLFRVLAYEDVRHLLKHKRTYAAAALTARQRALLASPALSTRLWRACVKPPYRWITRRLLGWPERIGARER
jgi:RIO-like serine/threonine protein kinase